MLQLIIAVEQKGNEKHVKVEAIHVRHGGVDIEPCTHAAHIFGALKMAMDVAVGNVDFTEAGISIAPANALPRNGRST